MDSGLIQQASSYVLMFKWMLYEGGLYGIVPRLSPFFPRLHPQIPGVSQLTSGKLTPQPLPVARKGSSQIVVLEGWLDPTYSVQFSLQRYFDACIISHIPSCHLHEWKTLENSLYAQEALLLWSWDQRSGFLQLLYSKSLHLSFVTEKDCQCLEMAFCVTHSICK
uniref:Uncharacterized protein n=1 Tax=Sphaerodactylus townsendi TaxID=933632 RepID=A0ACB8FAU0_9SAUR